MTLKILGDAANKLALAFACLTSRFVVAFLASWYVYSVATGFFRLVFTDPLEATISIDSIFMDKDVPPTF